MTEEQSKSVRRWGDLWAEIADEAEEMIGKDNFSPDTPMILAALLLIAERLNRR